MKKTNLFEVIRDIATIKSGDLNKRFNFNDAVSSNYILQRWISMVSNESACILNETTNKLWLGFDDNKELWYKLMLTIIPQNRYKKVTYIKKIGKIVNEKKDKDVEELANRYQLSQREVLEYQELIDKLKKEE